MKSSWCESFIQYTRACSPVPFAYRDRWEIAGQLFSDGSVRMYCSKNGGTIQSAGQSAGLAFASSWLDPKMEQVLPGKRKMIVDAGKGRRQLVLLEDGVTLAPPPATGFAPQSPFREEE